MVYCSAVGCNNDSRYVGKKEGVSYHKFPAEQKLQKEWLAKISRLDLKVTKDSRVCSVHFEPECYERDLKAELLQLKSSKCELKPGAVPTIFDHRPKKKPRLSSELRLQEKAKQEVRINNLLQKNKNSLHAASLIRRSSQQHVTQC